MNKQRKVVKLLKEIDDLYKEEIIIQKSVHYTEYDLDRLSFIPDERKELKSKIVELCSEGVKN